VCCRSCDKLVPQGVYFSVERATPAHTELNSALSLLFPLITASTISPSVSSSLPHASPAANLKPKEHVAYAILAIPKATSLAITGLTVPGIRIAIAAFAGFFAHEPLLVALGRRGTRAQRSTPQAKQHLFILLGLTVACGMIGFATGSTPVRAGLLVCALLATSSFLLSIAGHHRTLGGQLWGVVGLSVPCVPILLSGDLSLGKTMVIWTAWLIGFTATTVAVRGVIAFQKCRWIAIPVLTLVALFGLVAGLEIRHNFLAITTLPMLVMSGHLLWNPPPAKHLKRVGWPLVTGTIATAVWMIALV